MADETAVLEQPVAPAATPTPATPPAEASPAPAAPAAKETRRETLERVLKTPTNRGQHAVHQPREQGKFAGPPQFPTPPTAAPPTVPVAPARPDMPKSLKLELKSHWETTHPELAAAIVQREADYERGVQPLKTKAQQADELLKEFEPYQMLLKAENATPKQAIGSLLQTAAIFRTGTPLQKVQQVAGIMQTYGISLQHLQQVLGGQVPQQGAMDPQYNQIAQTVNQLQQTLVQRDQQELERNEARSLAAITAFAANTEHVEFEAVQDRMLALLRTPEAVGITPEMSDPEKLKVVYDAAIRLDPAAYAREQARQQAKEQASQQAARSKNAAVQVTGAPASGPARPVNPKDRRAFISNLVKNA